MKKHVASYVAVLLTMLLLDVLWLLFIGNPLYQHKLGHLLADQPRMGFVACFYLIYVAGLYYFAVLPTISSLQLKTTFLNGAGFGLVAYATYDLTNLALLQGWPVGVSMLDIVWGSILSAVSATVGRIVLGFLK